MNNMTSYQQRRARHGELEPNIREPKPAWAEVPEQITDALQDLFKGSIQSAETVYGGYSASATFKLTLTDGRSFFIKGAHAGQSRFIQQSLAKETKVYDEICACREFAPRIIGNVKSSDWTFIAMEYLGNTEKAPPWTEDKLNEVLKRLAAFHAVEVDAPHWINDEVKPFGEPSWRNISNDSEKSKGLCSLFKDPHAAKNWLENAAPRLIYSESQFPPTEHNHALLHCDIRSDNLLFCQEKRKVVFLDWSWLAIGSPLIDLSTFSVGVTGEGGPKPKTIFERYAELTGRPIAASDRAACAAHFAGFFANGAHQPPFSDAPRIRWIQRLQLFPALEWAAEELSLPRPPEPRSEF
jgi:aminoglycoside phosphotransferase (APT) family kinase protein